jgi:hypothetical protein
MERLIALDQKIMGERGARVSRLKERLVESRKSSKI